MCIYDALTIVLILSVKELKKKKKKALKCVFFASTVKTIRNLFIYFQLCASFFGMAPDLFCFSEKWCDQTQKLSSINKLYIRKKGFH